MKEYIFTTEGPVITAQVRQTIKSLEEQPWRVVLLDSYGKQIASCTIESESGFGAATEAVNRWLELNGYGTSWAVSL